MLIIYIVYSGEIRMKIQEAILRTLLAQICFDYHLYKNFISAKLKKFRFLYVGCYYIQVTLYYMKCNIISI